MKELVIDGQTTIFRFVEILKTSPYLTKLQNIPRNANVIPKISVPFLRIIKGLGICARFVFLDLSLLTKTTSSLHDMSHVLE